MSCTLHPSPTGVTRSSGTDPRSTGLRAIAIAAVLLYHTGGILPGGTVGVDLFFVLSGFLITTLLLEEKQSLGDLSTRLLSTASAPPSAGPLTTRRARRTRLRRMKARTTGHTR